MSALSRPLRVGRKPVRKINLRPSAQTWSQWGATWTGEIASGTGNLFFAFLFGRPHTAVARGLHFHVSGCHVVPYSAKLSVGSC